MALRGAGSCGPLLGLVILVHVLLWYRGYEMQLVCYLLPVAGIPLLCGFVVLVRLLVYLGDQIQRK